MELEHIANIVSLKSFLYVSGALGGMAVVGLVSGAIIGAVLLYVLKYRGLLKDQGEHEMNVLKEEVTSNIDPE